LKSRIYGSFSHFGKIAASTDHFQISQGSLNRNFYLLRKRRFKLMNKGELVDAIADKANVTKKQADAVLTAALETIVDAVSNGDKVTLVGFGSFESRERKAREGRNPKTGDKMEIPATKVPAFSAGKLFKEKVAPPEK
jgi:DNA-binding protein HU-beta